MVRDVFEHGYSSGIAAYFFYACSDGAPEGPERTAGEFKAGQLLEFAMREYEHRKIEIQVSLLDLLDDGLNAGKELLFHQQRQRLHTACDGAFDDLR